MVVEVINGNDNGIMFYQLLCYEMSNGKSGDDKFQVSISGW